MAAPTHALKENKKGPFLRALSRIGKIGRAAHAVRISRDAVHDWRRNDPAFAKAFLAAKNQFNNEDNARLQAHADFVLITIKPIAESAGIWPAICSTVSLAIANRRFKTDFKESAELRPDAPSRTQAEVARIDCMGSAYSSSANGATELRRPF